MSTHEELQALWQTHKKGRMPRACEGQEAAGIDLLILDADAAACVSDFMAGSGAMDDERWALLRECAEKFEQVIPALTGEAKEYFGRFAGLVARVLEKRG